MGATLAGAVAVAVAGVSGGLGAATAFGLIELFLAGPVAGVVVSAVQGWRRARA